MNVYKVLKLGLFYFMVYKTYFHDSDFADILGLKFKKIIVKQGYLLREINGEIPAFLFYSRIQKTVSDQFIKRTEANLKDLGKSATVA